MNLTEIIHNLFRYNDNPEFMYGDKHDFASKLYLQVSRDNLAVSRYLTKKQSKAKGKSNPKKSLRTRDEDEPIIVKRKSTLVDDDLDEHDLIDMSGDNEDSIEDQFDVEENEKTYRVLTTDLYALENKSVKKRGKKTPADDFDLDLEEEEDGEPEETVEVEPDEEVEPDDLHEPEDEVEPDDLEELEELEEPEDLAEGPAEPNENDELEEADESEAPEDPEENSEDHEENEDNDRADELSVSEVESNTSHRSSRSHISTSFTNPPATSKRGLTTKSNQLVSFFKKP